METKISIPEFSATALDAIPGIANTAQAAFRTHQSKNMDWRKVQLRKLYWAIVDYEPQLKEALRRDLRKGEAEAALSEINWSKDDAMWMLQNLDRLAKDEKLGSPDVPLMFSSVKIRIRKEPLGTALIVGPYNYPVMLITGPLIGAIAAGCTAVIKPSEMVPNVAMVMTEMIQKRLDPAAFAVVNGAVPETKALLDQRWDKIFFTGSAAVGTIVAKKAAETLTPVCLELGGTNPAFVTKKANLNLAARRLLWAKCLNAGQVCVSESYILVDKDVVDTFIHFLNVQYREMFPDGARASPDLPRIVNARHFQRLKKMLDSSSGKIVMGGQMDESDLFMEPTAVLINSASDPMLAEETFGPIFSILAFNNLDEALNVAQNVHRTPLALYSFGSKDENNKVLERMTSGGATLNDAFFHGSIPSVPFGGVGSSGWGSCRGKASFDCFSHFRTVAETPYWMEPLIRVRYMPYNKKMVDFMARLSAPKPNFNRNGQVVKGLGYWASVLLGMGASGVKGAFVRWVVVLASVYLASKR